MTNYKTISKSKASFKKQPLVDFFLLKNWFSEWIFMSLHATLLQVKIIHELEFFPPD